MPTHSTSKPFPQVIGFGEALFDVIGNEAILGGAPSNFAVHVNQLLQATGGSGAVVSRVGRDALGDRLRSELSARGVDVRWLQVDSKAPTGTVEVELDPHGHPTYDICRDVAWDQIEFTSELERLASAASAICFGTLVQRSPTSCDALNRLLLAAPQALRVCDLNLRAPHYTAEVIEQSLRSAAVLKLNDDELAITGEAIGLDAPTNNIKEQLEALSRRYGLETIAVTRGPAAAHLFHDGQHYEAAPPRLPAAANADSVGAGDAWCAALVVGLLQGLAPEAILHWANHVAADVASKRGATPDLAVEVLTPIRFASSSDL